MYNVSILFKMKLIFKVLILKHMEIRVTSTSIDIVCMRAVTTQNNVSTNTMNYKNILIK